MASRAKRSPRAKAAGGDAEAGTGPKIDEVLQRLEGVVEALEGGDLPLEQALARFEEGVKLARQGGALLDQIEARVEVLLAGDRDGEPRTMPFEEDDEPGEDDEEDDDGEF
jgi:exodeoxyribonuclease VII small subunit